MTAKGGCGVRMRACHLATGGTFPLLKKKERVKRGDTSASKGGKNSHACAFKEKGERLNIARKEWG